MDGKIDTDVTMVANDAFTKILSCVQESGLNYQIHMSPFSANISLKKSLVRTLDGSPVLPTTSKRESIISVHERELHEMRSSYEDIVQKLLVAYQTIEALKIDTMNEKNEPYKTSFSSKISSQNSTTLKRKSSIDDVMIKEECEVFDSDIMECDVDNTCRYLLSCETGTRNAFDDNFADAREQDIFLTNSSEEQSADVLQHSDGIISKLNSSQLPQNKDPDPIQFSSLVAHWLAPESYTSPSDVSFKAHCYNLPNSKLDANEKEKMLRRLQEILDKQERLSKKCDNCKQS